MPAKNKKDSSPDTSKKVGSSRTAAQSFGGKKDFGAPERDVRARQYASKDTKESDPGAAQPRSGSTDDRTTGVGGNDSGPGSSSGGDFDPDEDGLERQ